MQLNNFAGPLKSWADAAGDSVALLHAERSVSYSDLWREIRRFAAMFSQIGIRQGERVAIFLENRPETVIACLGAAAIGAIVVPMNWMLKPPQVKYILKHSAARCLVSSAPRLRLLAPALADLAPDMLFLSVDQRPPEATFAHRLHLAADFGSEPTGAPEFAPTIDEDPAVILYTSGSTGQPKGVLLSHRNMLQGAFSVACYLRMGRDDRVLCAIPLGFDAGLNQVTSTLFTGGTAVLHSYIHALEAVRCCEMFKVTGATGVPPFWMDLLDHPWSRAASGNMRYFATTGGPMPQPTLQSLRKLFPNAEPFLMYGLTEAYRSTYLDPALVDRYPGSVGKAMPNARVSVRRADGTLCAPREIGELVHIGPTVALGYWNDPEATAKRFRPIEVETGGLRRNLPAVWSGDLFWHDEDGFLYFVGRNDAMIKTSGFRVSPTEVEELVLGSGLAREAVALGLPDPKKGQVIGVCLSSSANAPDKQSLKDKVIRHCRTQAPGYMVPEVIFVADQLPRTPTGKFDRERCSEMLQHSLQPAIDTDAEGPALAVDQA